MEKFIEAAYNIGVLISEPVADGDYHRCPVIDGSSTTGSYSLNVGELTIGYAKNWKTGEEIVWRPERNSPISPDEKQKLDKLIHEHKDRRNKIRKNAANMAKDIWKDGAEAQQSFAYLANKKVKPYGIKFYFRELKLIIPVKNHLGQLSSLQFIDASGNKEFLTGGAVQGCYHMLGKPSDEIIICEGYATGATLHEHLNKTVVVAFHAANLKPVATELKSQFKRAKIIIACDNDQFTQQGNAGIKFGTEAATAVNGFVAVPAFTDTSTKPTDWNDFFRLNDAAALVEAFNSSVKLPVREVQVTDDKLPSTFEQIYDFPDLTEKDKVKATLQNIRYMLDTYGITCRYDIIRKKPHIVIPNTEFLRDRELTGKYTFIKNLMALNEMPVMGSLDFVDLLCEQNPFNPVAAWIESKPWDGVKRLQSFYDTVKSVGSKELKEILIMRWMISAIAAAYNPKGVSAHGVLVFTGKQYVGKTQWFKNLVPQDLRLTKDGLLLDPRDKDSVMNCVSNWIVELGEVDATFRKADIAQLKAFLTKDLDSLRSPYDRALTNFERRTVFFASVNDTEYLSDPTGSRRFWTIEVDELNHTHGLDMQQIWSEVLDLYKSGESWYLNTTEMSALNMLNENYEVVCPIYEKIAGLFDWEKKRMFETRIFHDELFVMLELKNPQRNDVRKINDALKKLGGKKPTRINGRFYYEYPPRLINSQQFGH
jgi:putative DNA primase/helicase